MFTCRVTQILKLSVTAHTVIQWPPSSSIGDNITNMFKLFPNFSIFTGGSGCCLRLASAPCQKYSFAAKVAINYSVYTGTHGRECCWAGVDAVVPRDPAVKCQRLYLETTITMLASHSSKLLWLHRLDNCQFFHLTSLKYSFVPLLCSVRLCGSPARQISGPPLLYWLRLTSTISCVYLCTNSEVVRQLLNFLRAATRNSIDNIWNVLS